MDSDFDFELPGELIAQQPPPRRGDSRLLLVEPGTGPVGEAVFRDLPRMLRAGDRLVLNDSRVLPARLWTCREDTGGRVEILLLRPCRDAALPGGWLCMARPARRLRPGQRLVVTAGPTAEPASAELTSPPTLTVLADAGAGEDGQVIVGCSDENGQAIDLVAIAEQWGVMPLPPYIKRSDGAAELAAADRVRYQTVYAAAARDGAGSVAAPTAGLHFSDATLTALAAAGIGLSRVSLHVGPGTFQPPSEAQISARRLHREFFRLPAATSAELAATRAAGGRIIAVGTTALRVLETVSRLGLDRAGDDRREFAAAPGEPVPVFQGTAECIGGHWEVAGETRLFIAPPERVTAADGLLTNFHLPGSSLLMLVASILGDGVWRRVYDHAVGAGLRFYSYGDCMLVAPGLAGASAAGAPPDKDGSQRD